jgi:hypothetical protein
MAKLCAFILLHLCAADPCTDLCSADGALVCTSGSWTKPDGVCHGYFHKPDGEEGYCYHSHATKIECPSSLRPLKASDLGSEDDVLIEFEDEGVWLQKNDASVQIFLALGNPELYRPIIKNWLSGVNKFFPLRTVMSIEKIFQFPASLVKEGFVANDSHVDGIFEAVCMNSNRELVGLYRFKDVADPPGNWADILCSMMQTLEQTLVLEQWL